MKIRGRVIFSAVLGIGVTLLLVFWRGFFWQHALLIGIGVLALVYSAFGTVERLKSLHRRP